LSMGRQHARSPVRATVTRLTIDHRFELTAGGMIPTVAPVPYCGQAYGRGHAAACVLQVVVNTWGTVRVAGWAGARVPL
jgi:hypothetical protein